MSSRIVLVLAVLLVIALSALLVLELTTGYFSGYNSQPAPVRSSRPTKPPAEEPKARSALCGTVDSRCNATALVDVSDCNPVTAEHRLESLLASPLSRGDCPQAMQRLASRCPPPCTIDPASTRIIAAKVEITRKEPGPGGTCQFEGRRTIEISGSCYR
ncbi:MAG: hypothetical protein KDD44_04460 [Bdellovibrionales bacterium]|nr:hypothetical protein [Bdellovibrionales bacterium]